MADLVPMSWKNSLTQLRDDVNRALDRWLSRWRGKNAVDREAFFWPSVFTSGGPAIDIGETDDYVTVTAELPGLDKNDFKVEVTENRLVIRGDKKQSYTKENGSYFYAERSYGSFARAINLPCEIDPNKAEAKFKNGLLGITLPKSERAKRKRIEVRG